MSNKRFSAARRLSVGVSDQILSSGSNFVAMVLAARALSVAGFGAFSLAMLTYNVSIGVVRALCSEAILVRPGGALGRHDKTTSGRGSNSHLMVGSAVALALAATPLLALGALITHGGLRSSLWVLAAALPVLLLQDSLRHVAFAQRRPGVALVSDAAWLVGMLVAFALLTTVDSPPAAAMIACWSAPSLLGAVAAVALLGVAPNIEPRLTWVRRNNDLSFRYLLDYLSGQGSGQLAVYSVALVSGVGAVASIRGSQTLFGTVAVLQTGAMAVLVPEGSRLAARSVRSVIWMGMLAGLAFFAVALGATAAIVWMPDAWGMAVLGDTWNRAQDTLLPIGLAAAVSGLMAGMAIGLRALSAAKEILRIRFFTAPAQLLLPIVGALIADAKGAAYGLVAAATWSCIWYVRATRNFVRNADQTPTLTLMPMPTLDTEV